MKQKIKSFFEATLYSYSQVFFAKNLIFGIILLLVSFSDWWMGVAGLVAIISANLMACLLGFSKKNIRDGIYGFNPLLVALGIAIYFSEGWNTLILVLFASVMTLFFSVVLQGVLGKYGLPFLSLPFLFTIWLLTISFNQFTNFGLNLSGLYTANELYSIGGIDLVRTYEYFQNLQIPAGLKTYFLSLGAIFFQFNILAGILIAIGLLIHSRHSFLISIIGFYAAYMFLGFLGVDSSAFNTSYYGFNFILSAIAIGSYFLIPNFKSLVFMLLLIPILALITIGTDAIFSQFNLPVYSLPFNVVVLTSLYALKLREKYHTGLIETPFQLRNPEFNAYYFNSILKSRKSLLNLNFSLPVIGTWYINQGFNGKYTHKDAWRYAWDFVIVGEYGREFTNKGDYPYDYYCYGKPVVAVEDGTIVEILDGVEDNIIGQINQKQNWGNTIVIYHGYGIYSQYSHLQKDSIKVTKGEYVKKGQIIANVGNSGRSPYPHLHFQFQTSNLIGSKTIEVPFSNYILYEKGKEEFIKEGYPKEGQKIAKLEPNITMTKRMQFVPGDVIEVKFNDEKEKELVFLSDIDILNNAYLQEENTDNFLYYSNEYVFFRTLNYLGKQNSALYYFYNAMHFLPLELNKNLTFKDTMPSNLNHIFLFRLLQDFFVSFYMFITTEYRIKLQEIDNELNPNKIIYDVNIDKKIFGITVKKDYAKVIFDNNSGNKIHYYISKKTITIEWKKRLLSY